jgi:catechol 2,3-dioxygenase-like lactoylglutathione lyase family enzyme
MQKKPQFGFALEYVTDIEAARRFYVDVVGLEVERYHATFVQFANFAIASDASMSGTRDTELYWLVDDAEEAFREMSTRAEISLPLKQQAFGKVFGIRGPNGEPRYMVELSADRPSKAMR